MAAITENEAEVAVPSPILEGSPALDETEASTDESKGSTSAAVGDEVASNSLVDAFANLTVDTIPELEQVFNKLVADHPVAKGKEASTADRNALELKKTTLVYGEITFRSYAIAFEKIKNKYGGLQNPGGVFYDLGSGTGKPVLSAALLHDFDQVKGIELLESLHNIALELQQVWESSIRPTLSERKQKTDVQFFQGDITKMDWCDATCCFANSTCFDEPLMKALAKKAELLKPGTFFITFTKRLPSDAWEVLEHESHKMSWGNATVYIQRKK